MAKPKPRDASLTRMLMRAHDRAHEHVEPSGMTQPPCSVDESAGGFPPLRPLAYPVTMRMEGAPWLVPFTFGTDAIVSCYSHENCPNPETCAVDRVTKCGDFWNPETGMILGASTLAIIEEQNSDLAYDQAMSDAYDDRAERNRCLYGDA